MRVFVAVDLPDAVRQAAAAAAASLKDALGRAHARSRLTWVEPSRLHLTLVFVGEVADAVGAAVVDRLQEPLPLPPFTIRLGEAGMFPPSGRPRVLWLAVTEGARALADVQAAVVHRLEGLEYRREARAFSPHLTIARFKDGGTLDERRAVEHTVVPASATGTVDRVTVYRSVLSPKAPQYTPLGRSALAGGA